MERIMYEIEVYPTEKGFVAIKQDISGDDVVVLIHPSQFKTVMAWLNEAFMELSDEDPVETDGSSASGPVGSKTQLDLLSGATPAASTAQRPRPMPD